MRLLPLALALLLASCGASEPAPVVGELFNEPASDTAVRVEAVGGCGDVRAAAPELAERLHSRGVADAQRFAAFGPGGSRGDAAALPVPEVEDRTEAGGGDCVAYTVAIAPEAGGGVRVATVPPELVIMRQAAFLQAFERGQE